VVVFVIVCVYDADEILLVVFCTAAVLSHAELFLAVHSLFHSVNFVSPNKAKPNLSLNFITFNFSISYYCFVCYYFKGLKF